MLEKNLDLFLIVKQELEACEDATSSVIPW
jgi:hypothetical protein